MKMKISCKVLFAFVVCVVIQAPLFARGRQSSPAPAEERQPVVIMVAAAASLRNAYEEELIPRFQAE
ncbi:MAG: molybdate ABC transporter substrate-binding protein, partial [Treponema sp.]|nr:molybdate ABC transporter substrate-binding protein [Treponema sp.]